MMAWLKYFNYHSWKVHSRVVHNNLGFKKWFSCTPKRTDPKDPESNEEINPDGMPFEFSQRQRTEPDQRIYRLLLLDSFSGHHSLELYEYCLQFDIIILYMPPHSS